MYVSQLLKESFEIAAKGYRVWLKYFWWLIVLYFLTYSCWIFNESALGYGARVLHYDENDAFEAVVFKQDSTIADSLELTAAQLKKLTPSQQNALVPVVESGHDKLQRVYLEPLKMNVIKKSAKDRARYDPDMIKQIFLKQKAIAENEAWSKFVKQIKMLLIAGMIFAALAAGVAYMNYDKLKLMAGG